MFGPAIVELNVIGIMHTNISEANMMTLWTDESRGFLVGFEFELTIVDPELRESKRIVLGVAPRLRLRNHAVSGNDFCHSRSGVRRRSRPSRRVFAA
jgi:hypothetical protein